jgi:UDP-MurNAc hydroxylase
VLNQNDARPGDPDVCALGPFDAQIVQFSGAIWYPIAYDFHPELKSRLARGASTRWRARQRRVGRRRATFFLAPDRRPSSTTISWR